MKNPFLRICPINRGKAERKHLSAIGKFMKVSADLVVSGALNQLLKLHNKIKILHKDRKDFFTKGNA